MFGDGSKDLTTSWSWIAGVWVEKDLPCLIENTRPSVCRFVAG